MDEIWERAIETALDGEKNSASVRSLTLDGAVKCFHGRLPPPDLLEKFRNLEHLSIANIGLSSLEKFPHLPKLQRLILSDNRIAGGLEFLVEAGLESLRDLDLSNNRIQRMEDLSPLSKTKLVSLDLYECPVTKVQNYRSLVFGWIKSLKFLDKMDPDGNERPESDEEEEEDDEEEDEEEDEDDEEDDPGSGEVDGESKSSKISNGGNFDGQGVLDVDEDEESDADEEERETEEIPNGSEPALHSNGFRVASVRDEDDGEEEEDEECLGEEIDEEEGEEEDIVELQEIDGSDDGDGIEDEEEDDEEDDDVDEVDEEEEVEPVSTGRLTSTDGEIDGHDHEEEDGNGEIGEEEEANIEDGKSVDEDDNEDDDEDGDYGTEYLVQPLGLVDEEDAGGSDYNPGDEDEDMEEEEVDDDDDDEEVQKEELQSHPSSSLQAKRKRSEEDDDDDDDAEAEEEEDIPASTKFKRQH